MAEQRKYVFLMAIVPAKEADEISLTAKTHSAVFEFDDLAELDDVETRIAPATRILTQNARLTNG